MKSNLFAATFIVALLWCASTFATITIDTVPVGDVGNPNDLKAFNPYGGVSYAYSIGKYEVTVGQYTAFLNAVAATDTYNLYNTSMATDLHTAGIARSGETGSYSYSVIGSPNHPVTYVSWADAWRFANWLHNGQPTGPQNGTTTEDGAYTLNGATTGLALQAVFRNANATWFIPTENEWYKAAYYQPAAKGGDSDGYWAYPTRSNSEPFSDQPPGATPDNSRVANFYRDDQIANGYNDGHAITGSPSYSNDQNYLTDVGAYSTSPSYYGTFDQSGNVRELTETSGGFPYPSRVVRGGSWHALGGPGSSAARETTQGGEGPESGFRVATIFVPEPSSYLLCASATTALLRCLGRNRHARL